MLKKINTLLLDTGSPSPMVIDKKDKEQVVTALLCFWEETKKKQHVKDTVQSALNTSKDFAHALRHSISSSLMYAIISLIMIG